MHCSVCLTCADVCRCIFLKTCGTEHFMHICLSPPTQTEQINLNNPLMQDFCAAKALISCWIIQSSSNHWYRHFFSVDNKVLIKVTCPGTVSIAIYSDRPWWFLRFAWQHWIKCKSYFEFFLYCFIVSSPFSSSSIRFMSHQHT